MGTASVVPFSDPPLSNKRKHVRTRQKFITRQQLGKRSSTARLFDEMATQIEGDLGGRSNLSRIELELVECFVGAAILMRHLNARMILQKADDPVNIAAFASAATAMSRLGGQLGLSRRQREIVTPSLSEYLAERKQGGSS